jgi:hypothetical protein
MVDALVVVCVVEIARRGQIDTGSRGTESRNGLHRLNMTIN